MPSKQVRSLSVVPGRVGGKETVREVYDSELEVRGRVLKHSNKFFVYFVDIITYNNLGSLG